MPEQAIKAYPHALAREMIVEVTGDKRSSRDAYIQRLLARQLLSTGRGAVRVKDVLFEGDAMNFWDVHGWLFLICIALFPRLTILFAVTVPFGWLAWLGWLFVPHLLVAILATTYYWDTNPVLCVIAWFIGIGGTFGESKAVDRRH